MLRIQPKEKEYSIRSIEEFVEIIRQFDRSAIYRGVSDSSYELVTSLGRKKRLTINEESRLLHLFDTYATEFEHYRPRDAWEKLIVAQHHGLPTRLMDWSRNALVALYFASLGDQESDGVVYGFYPEKWLSIELKNHSPFEVNEVCAVLPTIPTPRVKAQSGIHTVHPNYQEPFVPDDMVQINFRSKFKSKFLYDLEKLGIHHASMFPDLDGLTKYIRFVVRGEGVR